MNSKKKYVIIGTLAAISCSAIIGVGMLYTGIQGSVLGDNLTTSIMLVVVGIVLLFIGLIMVLGKANIHTTEIIVHKKEEEKK